MRFFRRSLVALGVAAILPVVLLSAVLIFSLLQDHKQRIEEASIARTQEVSALTDAQLAADFSALDLLATSRWLSEKNFTEFYARVRRSLNDKPHWAGIILYDLNDKTEIFDSRRELGAPQPAPVHCANQSPLPIRDTHIICGIEREQSDPEQSRLYLHKIVSGEAGQQPPYMLTLAIKPQIFQTLLTSQVKPGVIAAIVDGSGRFLARSINYQERVGQPGSTKLLEAVHSGKREGFYRSRTLEGLDNYTAFHTSDISGWSTHIAVAAPLIDSPQSWSLLVAILAGIGGIALGATLVVLVLRDMAERRRAEETLRQSQKMEAIGQLTGGIAHDFNNLLTAVIGNLDMIRMRAKHDPRLQQLAQNGLEAARRGAKLSTQLLAFSRSQRMSIGPVDLEKLLNGMQNLIAQSAGPAITIRLVVHPLGRYVMSENNQLELAFLNLAVNARDAMPNGGSLVIASRIADESDTAMLPAGDYVAIDVTDTGSGMTEEVRARALEPFFTTKAVGHGTGLGLSQVFGVVHESGGVLHIESEVGTGTTIRLVLPAVPPHLLELEHARPMTRRPATQSASTDTTVLIVDDDVQVRRFVAGSLEAVGYQTYEAATGAIALDMLQTLQPKLIITDFAMPGMNGAELAARITAQYPKVRILMMSGYADSAAIDTAARGTPLLRKPFDVGELTSVVAELLEK